MLVMRKSMKKDFTLTERAMHVTHCDNIGNNVRDMKENIFTNKVFSRFTFHVSLLTILPLLQIFFELRKCIISDELF